MSSVAGYGCFTTAGHPDGGGGAAAAATLTTTEGGLIDAARVRTIGRYENWLRFHAPPGRWFDHFASVRVEPAGGGGESFMMPEDMYRAVVPFSEFNSTSVGASRPLVRLPTIGEVASRAERASEYVEVLRSALATAPLPPTAFAEVRACPLAFVQSRGVHSWIM